jgi:MoaA/NifB/PqqE/SkfB family radical SAM enzyme
MANLTTPYLSVKTVFTWPRLPLEGNLDLTYRCNNTCRHCWVWLAPNAPEQQDELSFDEIRQIADEARALGTRAWHLSGGEPMLRDDFTDIFDYLTHKAASYSLNTNGTLITPEIAQLLKRKGSKLIALYGATAETYDRVTRHAGGFEMAMRGFCYLQEAGAGFTVQLIPMRDNWQEWEQMQALARSLSQHWRVGAAWLYKSAYGSPAHNAEIDKQRLDPRAVIALDEPIPQDRNPQDLQKPCKSKGDDRLFAQCIAGRQDFHIDPYGQMTWCSFIKDPALRYDLRRGTFRAAWEEFIPSCADRVRGGDEWRENCGSCDRRADCRWCAVYAYLETGRYSARVPYLCTVADEVRKFKAGWLSQNRRYFRIAGITVRVESDLDFDAIHFKPELASFTVDGPGDDNVTLRHYFELPDLQGKDLGEELYRKPPWAISRQKNGTWFYRGISSDGSDHELHRVATFSPDYAHGTIYSLPRDLERIREDGWQSLSLFPTDQIWLAPLLADRNAVLLHSAAAVVNGQGLVFVGHSSAGKSTTMEMLKAAGVGAEILCDDRNIVRKWDTPVIASPRGAKQSPNCDEEIASSHKSLLTMAQSEWRVHGTWSHGTTADVSPASAPLRAILFLHQEACNEIRPLTDRKEIWRHLLATLIRPMATAEWWRKELDVMEQIVKEVRCYSMKFDKSGAIVEKLSTIVGEFNRPPDRRHQPLAP